MEPPRFSPVEGTYGEPIQLQLLHDDPTCEIYYRMGYWGEDTLYNGPLEISGDTYIYAYAESGGVKSDEVYAYYEMHTDPPRLGE